MQEVSGRVRYAGPFGKDGVPTYVVNHALPEAAVDRLAGTLLGEDSYDFLVTSSCDVLTPEGKPLLLFRKGYLPVPACQAAWVALRDAATPTDNRGVAAGDVGLTEAKRGAEVKGRRRRNVKTDGTVSRTTRAKNVLSGVVGYFDRAARHPYCRMTAYTLDNPDRFGAALPFFRACSDGFKALLPQRHAAQMQAVRETSPDFLIHGTAFTTVTVNKNWQTAVHKDAGDLREGFGVMSALTAGAYEGCYLVFPRYRVAVDLRSCDLLLADVHEWHGNTPLVPRGAYERISTVLYYREGIRECGTAAEELARAKSRERGTPLKGKIG